MPLVVALGQDGERRLLIGRLRGSFRIQLKEPVQHPPGSLENRLKILQPPEHPEHPPVWPFRGNASNLPGESSEKLNENVGFALRNPSLGGNAHRSDVINSLDFSSLFICYYFFSIVWQLNRLILNSKSEKKTDKKLEINSVATPEFKIQEFVLIFVSEKKGNGSDDKKIGFEFQRGNENNSRHFSRCGHCQQEI